MCDSKCSLGTSCSSEGCKARQKTNFVSRKGIVMYLCLPWNCYTRTYIYIYLYYVHKSQCIPFISPWSSIVFNRVPKLHRRNRSESQQHIDHTWRAHKGRLTGSWVPSKISPQKKDDICGSYMVNILLWRYIYSWTSSGWVPSGIFFYKKRTWKWPSRNSGFAQL